MKIKALKQVSALVTIGTDETWVHLKGGQILEGIGMVIGVEPQYAPKAPIQIRSGQTVAIFPISETSPNEFSTLFEIIER